MIFIIRPNLPPGTLDQRAPVSKVKSPYPEPRLVVVSRESEPGKRYVFEQKPSIERLYQLLLSDDQARMLDSAVRNADIEYLGDRNGTALANLLPEAHIGNYRTRDTDEKFQIFYR